MNNYTTTILKSLLAGSMIGIIAAASAIAFAGLIYSGPLSPYLLIGTSACLIGTLVLTLILSCFSSSKYALGESQDVFAAIVAVVSTKIGQMAYSMPPNSVLPTLIAILMITSLSCGLLMFLLGQFKLGKLIRYFPYPVIGGFLAGTGLLVLSESFYFLTDIPFDFSHISAYCSPPILWLWVLPLAYALCLNGVMKRYNHYSILFYFLAGALLLFYGYLFVSHTTLAEAGAKGWLLGPLPVGALNSIPSMALSLGPIQWNVIAQFAPDCLVLMNLAIISLLLNVSSFELTSNQAMDVNKELKVTGIANLILGSLGALGGYQSLSISSISFKFKIGSRLVGIIAALSITVIILLGTSIINILPKFVFGILLLYIAIEFMHEWLVEIKNKVTLPNYFIILIITIIIASKGFLTGLLVGLFLSLVMFVIRYSNVNVIRAFMNGDLYRSTVERTEQENIILNNKGKEILIPIVSGYLFFGNSAFIVNKIISEVNQNKEYSTRYIVFDFSRVTGMEVTCFMSIIKLVQWCQQYKICLVFASLPSEIKNEIHYFFTDNKEKELMYYEFLDLDHAIEWCEDTLLAEARATLPPSGVFQFPGANADENKLLSSYFESIAIKQNEIIYKQGEHSDSLLYLLQGSLNVFLGYESAHQVRVTKIKEGAIVGEMGLFLKEPRSATIVANSNSIIYKLTDTSLQKLYKEQPDLGITLDRLVINFLGKRIQQANKFSRFIRMTL